MYRYNRSMGCTPTYDRRLKYNVGRQLYAEQAIYILVISVSMPGCKTYGCRRVIFKMEEAEKTWKSSFEHFRFRVGG